MEKNVEEKVKEILAETSGIEPSDIEMGSELENDLGLDSLDSVELMMSLEEEYNFEISDEEAVKLKTTGDVIAFIEKKVK